MTAFWRCARASMLVLDKSWGLHGISMGLFMGFDGIFHGESYPLVFKHGNGHSTNDLLSSPP